MTCFRASAKTACLFHVRKDFILMTARANANASKACASMENILTLLIAPANASHSNVMRVSTLIPKCALASVKNLRKDVQRINFG